MQSDEVPKGLAEAFETHRRELMSKYVSSVYGYGASETVKMKLVALGDRSLFKKRDHEGWWPLAQLIDDKRFLAISQKSPYPVSIVEKGELRPRWKSLEQFLEFVVARKIGASPFMDALYKYGPKGGWFVDRKKWVKAREMFEKIIAWTNDEIDIMDNEQALVWDYYGRALHAGPKALAAYERSIAHGRLYVEIFVIQMYMDAKDWQAAIDYAKKLRVHGKIKDIKTGVWIGRYAVAAHAMLGEYKAAQNELRGLLKDYNHGPIDTYEILKEVQLDLRRFFRLHPDVKKEMTLAMREFQPY